MNAPKVVTDHKAETTGGIAGFVTALGAQLGLPTKWVGVLALVTGALPLIVTYVTNVRRAAAASE